ncbi:MAG: hypothetical protein LBF77_07355, partial [Spirochaetaceae bacterium]|nr:hypothetical protein [Spirochaetaceae bacterium]
MMVKFLKSSCWRILFLSLVLFGCTNNNGERSFTVTAVRDGNTTVLSADNADQKDSLRIVSGSENRELEFLLEDFCGKNGAAIVINYMRSEEHT